MWGPFCVCLWYMGRDLSYGGWNFEVLDGDRNFVGGNIWIFY